MSFTWWSVALLMGAGVLGGFINTIAGGGSMITVPALMLLGMPADHANATNRVGILQQSLTGVRGFNEAGKLERGSILPMLLPTVSGAVLGALSTTWLPPDILKPALLGAMILIALVMLALPDVIAPPEGTRTYSLRERPLGFAMLFGAGLYGGFVQAGVGFILIAALAAGMRYDLVRTNALKVVCTAMFSVAALAVFILTGRVEWISGIILAVGMTIGASASVRFALNVEQRVIKWALFVMVCLTSASVLVFT
ncbi:MAG: sulfite exporter TauE/SafE family protein [Chloroflexi bacterium]|nr:sulfite exporter TauE/SafE family protein [Chloroflexota bacterium]